MFRDRLNNQELRKILLKKIKEELDPATTQVEEVKFNNAARRIECFLPFDSKEKAECFDEALKEYYMVYFNDRKRGEPLNDIGLRDALALTGVIVYTDKNYKIEDSHVVEDDHERYFVSLTIMESN
ncbi:hypothetical protein [Shouchella clausii]|uniref:hypothetical protein n=1 Tax=Shouchella clausii TaxID=79880 RepID=UPI000BA6BE93|nr:hypothetical protein [Shouchella clausii]PAD91642.1 hypothetical protein CHH52_13545 [Shouchella clausii]